ncbi:MAG: NUDIX domain-containing protein [Flavisolibacter sp.]
MKISAGVLLYRKTLGVVEVLLVHPGGPFWKGKEKGAWSIPKGEIEPGENPLEAAKREFMEETGFYPMGESIELKSIKQKGGKIVMAWLMQGDLDLKTFTSSSFEMEWPYKSGKKKTFLEVDKAAWVSLEEALTKINNAQCGFIEEMKKLM